jgi:bacterioferritin-associated ferredoxin
MTDSISEISVEVKLRGRDEVKLCLRVDSNQVIQSGELEGIGCSELLAALMVYRTYLHGPLAALPLPCGSSHVDMIIREVILRIRGEWESPFSEEELCHCRKIPTSDVDVSVLNGCHTLAAVTRATSAGSSCGNCRTDIEKIISYRIG